MHLPSNSSWRKEIPLATGCLDYFPKALAMVAQLSKYGNDKHNPGQPLHWSRDKSTDHADCIMRHMVDRGTIDEESGFLHDVMVAWRALAQLELALEKLQEAEIPDTNINEVCESIDAHYAENDPLMAGAGDGKSEPWVPEAFVPRPDPFFAVTDASTYDSGWRPLAECDATPGQTIELMSPFGHVSQLVVFDNRFSVTDGWLWRPVTTTVVQQPQYEDTPDCIRFPERF